MRIGYLECFSGISGDMLLGALVDAGVPFRLLEETAAALNVGARLETRKVMRGGLTATKVDVITPEHAAAHAHSHEHDSVSRDHDHTHEHSHDRDHAQHGDEHEHEHAHDQSPHSHEHSHDHDHAHEHHGHDAGHAHKELTHAHGNHEHHSHAEHRSLSSILAIIRAAPLGERVKERASRAFQLLGEAEAAIHSIPIEQVHFHEVGAVDTIADIVCSAAGCESLGVGRWICSPLNVGSGTVKCAHGTLPVPAPATIALLGDAPVYAAGEPMERVTPTGAAILRMLDVRYGPLPAMRVQSRGYGAGGRDTPGSPNLLRILVGEDGAEVVETGAGEPIAVIEATIDDSSPQLLGYVSELLLAAGAWDVFRQAVQMKKGRTGVQMTVLCRPDLVPALREMLFRETTTIGLRWRFENKMALAREFSEVETPWGKVKMKIARWPSGEVANAAPEYEDCRRLAEQHAIPLKQVMQEAMRLYAEVPHEAI
jgi:pyridinium-3,5-bisthiocarboxylic acid mononucleotide nickel chelatase